MQHGRMVLMTLSGCSGLDQSSVFVRQIASAALFRNVLNPN
ncbi:hypothetical protein Pla144_48250 [Bythopirellula polymerisocia]|uniref:Uncharacterized protein n=1 Tax=Bythopirellula polymerisocia TaxID=2528003 RepID=A0A5C6CBH9_9BACT|nr:hypothetical protein Pla144_48250 [Bythopirellula polymerisocia]